MKLPLFGPVAIDTVDMLAGMTDEQRVNLITEACNSIEFQGTIDKVRAIVESPEYDDE